MVTLAVLAVLLSIAVPSFNEIALSSRLRSYSTDLVASALLARSEAIVAADLGLPALAAVPAPADEPDRSAIEAALSRHAGVVAQAAAELGLSRQALYRRMERLGIARP